MGLAVPKRRIDRHLAYISATSPLYLPQVDVIKFLLYEQVKGLMLGLGLGSGLGVGLGL